MKRGRSSPPAPSEELHKAIMPSENNQPRVSLGRQQHSSEAIQSTTAKAAQRLAEIPFWAVPLPLPPEYDFQADVEADRRLAAVMCAVARVAKDRGETFASQVEIWKGVIK